MGLSAALSAGVSYVVVVVAARVLPASENAIFLVYWGLLFGMFGLFTGLSSEAARVAHATRATGSSRSSVVLLAVVFATGVCLLFGASGTFWATRVFGDAQAWFVILVLGASIAFAGHAAVAGVLTASGDWNGVISATTCDALVRLLVALVALLAFASLNSLVVAMALSSVSWSLALLRTDVRNALHVRVDVPVFVQIRKFVHACAGSGSSAILVVGFPVLVRLTASQPDFLRAAPLLLAVTLTRAPLMIPLSAYQGVALAHLLRNRHRGVAALYPIGIVLTAGTGVLAAFATFIGPDVLALLLGPEYVVSGGLLGTLTIGAGLLALLTLTGAACLASSAHVLYSTGWVVATASAVLVLLLPLDLHMRVAVSLVIGPLIGGGVHLYAMRVETEVRSC